MKKIILQLSIVLVFTAIAVLFPGSAHAIAINNCNNPPQTVSSYADPACFCPSDYPVSEISITGTRYCCPQGYTFEVRLTGESCVSGGNEVSPALAKALFGGAKGLCQGNGTYLVEPGGDNYCIAPGEQVGAGDGTFGGRYFLACGASTSNKTSAKTDGSVLQLASYCTGNEGIFVTQEEYDNGVCICNADKRNAGQADNADECNTECNGSGTFYGGSAVEPGTNEACDLDPECAACRDKGYTYTALGCIDTSRSGLITWLIRLAIIVVMVAIIFRFVQASMLIRSGDPEKIKEGQEIVTSAVIALILVLVSVPLLEFIGVKILNVFPEGFITTGN